MLNLQKINEELNYFGLPLINFFYAFEYKQIYFNEKELSKRDDVFVVFIDVRDVHLYETSSTMVKDFGKNKVVFADKIVYFGLKYNVTEDFYSHGNEIVNKYLNNIDIIELFITEEKHEKFLNTLAEREIIENFTKSFERQRENIKAQIDQKNNDKKYYMRIVADLVKDIDDLRSRYNQKLVIDELVTKLRGELDLIRKHKAVTSITFDNECIEVKTNTLYMNEPYTNRRYLLGKMLFKFNIMDGDCYFENLTEDRSNYWGGGAHPHVDECGYACLGNAETQIAQYIIEKEYYAVFLTIMSFLQTANIDDPAGYHISEWDEVDKDGNIINQGHAPTRNEYNGYGDTDEGSNELIECPVCGNEFEEDSGYACCDCNNEVCSENELHETVDGEWVCDNCIRNNYIWCDGCNRYVLAYLAFNVDDNHYCPDCYHDRYGEEEEE